MGGKKEVIIKERLLLIKQFNEREKGKGEKGEMEKKKKKHNNNKQRLCGSAEERNYSLLPTNERCLTTSSKQGLNARSCSSGDNTGVVLVLF